MVEAYSTDAIMKERRFILDVHLGKLTRYLRILGIDCFYSPDLQDDQIIELACREDRIILSRDRALLQDKRVVQGHFPQSKSPEEQVREIVTTFDLRPQLRPLSLCLDCNVPIRPIEKTAIADRLPPRVRQIFSEYYSCPHCEKVYWKGSHYDKMMNWVQELQGHLPQI